MGDSVLLTSRWAPGAELVTFNRPEVLNAVDARMLDDLEEVLATLEADVGVRVVILTGVGRAFVGGGDVAHMAALSPDEGERFVGRGIAKDLILTARRLSAAEALTLGIVNRVVPLKRLLPACQELAGALMRNSFLAIRQAKKAIDEGAELSLDQGLVVEAEAWLVNFCSADRVEGLRAFVEKRRPVYRGRHGTTP